MTDSKETIPTEALADAVPEVKKGRGTYKRTPEQRAKQALNIQKGRAVRAKNIQDRLNKSNEAEILLTEMVEERKLAKLKASEPPVNTKKLTKGQRILNECKESDDEDDELLSSVDSDEIVCETDSCSEADSSSESDDDDIKEFVIKKRTNNITISKKEEKPSNPKVDVKNTRQSTKTPKKKQEFVSETLSERMKKVELDLARAKKDSKKQVIVNIGGGQSEKPESLFQSLKRQELQLL